MHLEKKVSDYRRWRKIWMAIGLLLLINWDTPFASAQVAPDATGVGPLETTSAEYKFPATIDPEILDVPPPTGPLAVELWARVYRPADLSGGPYPLLIFLHGNHGTCGTGSNPRQDDRADYTFTGTCPEDYVVVPNHLGYGYLAERLASWGYIVVSINANRGITAGPSVIPDDLGLNLARGRLVLRHLQRLSDWNTGGGTPESLGVDLQGKLDFNNLGLMGHSRGGEGMRAAYNLYRDQDSPWPDRIPDAITFRGIFEIAPVDGQTARVLNADGTAWNVLLPMCDGDVSNLQGVHPFDRMLRIFTESPATQKSTYTVWGANHNFYNTEWQVSDSRGCFFHDPLFPFYSDSPAQQQTGLASVMAFFRGNIGPFADLTFNQNFNPLFDLPPVVTEITRVDRGFTPSPNRDITAVFEDFDRPTGINTYGTPNDASNITIAHINRVTDGTRIRHDPTQRTGVIFWDSPSTDTYFQTNWMPAGEGLDISNYKTLDFRVSRRYSPSLNPDPNVSTNFSIRLALSDGTLSSPVQLRRYTDLKGPVGGAFAGNLHPILQTVRIPLMDFQSADLTQVRGVRLTFDDTEKGAIFVANIRLSILFGSGVDSFLAGLGLNIPLAELLVPDKPLVRLAVGVNNMSVNNTVKEGSIISIRSVVAATSLQSRPDVEIEVYSDQDFPVRNELVVLRIGERQFLLSRYPGGDTHRLIFTLSGEEFAQTATGEEVAVEYGRDQPNDWWNLGRLDKSLLDK